MKRILLAATAAFAFAAAQPAIAADAPVYKGPAPVAAVLFNWTGFYIGATAGYGWGTTNQSDGFVSSPTFKWDGALVGGTIGWNWQAPGSAIVFGIEGDISWAGIKGSLPTSGAWGCGGPTCHNEVQSLATIRGRLGVAMDRVLVFATGGWAYGKVYADFNSCAGACVANTNSGWTAGAGFEWAFAQNVSMKVEYLYVDLGSFVATVPGGTTGLVAKFNLVRVGANWRF